MATEVFDLIENYSEENVINLIRDVEKIFDSEDNLIYISEGKTMIIGDLHGDYNTLKKIINKLHDENFQTLIFLGDYVDRGPSQVEVINALFYYNC